MKKLLVILSLVALVAGCEEPVVEINNNIGIPPVGTRLIDKISQHYEYGDGRFEAYTIESVFGYDSKNRVVRIDYYNSNGTDSWSAISYGNNTLTVTFESIYDHPLYDATKRTTNTSTYDLNSDGYIYSYKKSSTVQVGEEPPYDNNSDFETYKFSISYNNHYIDSSEMYIKFKETSEGERTIKDTYTWTDGSLTGINGKYSSSFYESEYAHNIQYGNIINPNNVNIDLNYLAMPFTSSMEPEWFVCALGFIGKSSANMLSSTGESYKLSWNTDKEGYIISCKIEQTIKNTETGSVTDTATFEISYKN